MQPMSRLLYLLKRFVPGLLDLVHHLRRSKQAPHVPQAKPPVEGEQRSAA
jgi:hypothetical protein